MKIHPLFYVITALFCVTLSSCGNYYMSPLNTISNPYTPMPLKEKDESAKKATYVGLHFSPSANTYNDFNDGEETSNSAGLRVLQSHAFGAFRASYGAVLNMGSYNISKPSAAGTGSSLQDYRYYNGGNLFWGGTGINASISAVKLFARNKGEWRYIGLQGSVQKEFGKYLDFRQKMPGNLNGLDYVERRGATTTLGLFTEFVRRTRSGMQIGYKGAIGVAALSRLFYAYNQEYDRQKAPALADYVSNTFHMTKNRVTGFIQLNFGREFISFQTGAVVRISREK